MANFVRYIVEGSNFVATLTVDGDVFTNAGDKATNGYLEAATKTIEYIFRHGPDTSDDFDLLMRKGEEPMVGCILGVCKDGDLGDEAKQHYVKTATAAENAGVLEIVKHFADNGWPA